MNHHYLKDLVSMRQSVVLKLCKTVILANKIHELFPLRIGIRNMELSHKVKHHTALVRTIS